MKQKRSCANCTIGTPIPVNCDILCRFKGVVSPEYVCSKHRFIPSARAFREINYKCLNCDNFIIKFQNPEDGTSMGLCQLFSVRQFDGRQRNACSKFVKRRIREVS